MIQVLEQRAAELASIMDSVKGLVTYTLVRSGEIVISPPAGRLADFVATLLMAARPTFRGVGVNVLDAGLLTALLQKNRSRCFHTTFAHGKRKVIEIKRDVLRTRRGRPFNRKIDALVTFSMMGSRHSEQCRLV